VIYLFDYIGPSASFAFLGSFLGVVISIFMTVTSLLIWPFRVSWRFMAGLRSRKKAKIRKLIFLGLDGLDPRLTEMFMAAGKLPNLSKLMQQGSFRRLRTTFPALSPVAWSTFATGVNPGGHGIFDFLRRDPATYLPDLSLNRYEQKNAFVPPKAVNLRGGVPLWDLLAGAGIPSARLGSRPSSPRTTTRRTTPTRASGAG